MASIIGIGTCRPPQRTVEELSDELGFSAVDARRFRRSSGFDRICVDPDRREADLLLEAIEAVPGIDGLRERVTWVVRARSIRFAAPWPDRVIAEVCERAGLGHARAFTVSDHACAAGMFATELAVQLLTDDGDPDAVAIVLTGEKTYGLGSRVIPRIALMGEATAAVAVSLGSGSHELLGYASRQVPIGGESLALDEVSSPLFSQIYDGEVGRVIGRALAEANADTSELQRYLPHNVGRMVSVRTGTSVGFRHGQIDHGTLAETGHCWSADTFMNIEAAQRDGRLARGDIVLLTAVGLGATFAAMVCRYAGEHVPADHHTPAGESTPNPREPRAGMNSGGVTTSVETGFRTRLDACYRTDNGPRVWLGNFEVEQVWARGATSLPRVSSREGTATVARLDEFALWMATSADVVLLTDDTDPEFASYVSSITREAPRIISLGAGASYGLVSEAALDAARASMLPDFPAGAAVVAHGYSRVEREFAAAAGLGWVAPDVDDVVAVNSKIYSRNLADELGIRQPRGTTCERVDDWDRAWRFARALLQDGPVVVKEEHGVSGKGMAVVDSPARLDRIAKRILNAAERNDGRVGFIVERWVDKDRDFNYQLTIDRDGRIALDFVKQILTRSGVHLGHVIPAELAPAQLDEIRRTAERIGARLYRNGYWGVVGIDALTETDGTFHPLIEINARCNMSTYQLPAQEAFGDAGDAALARHYEIRADRPIPFARVREVLGDLLLVPGRTRGMVVLNHATVNAAGAVAAEGEQWIGRLYGLLRDRDRTALDELDAEVANALAPLSTGAVRARSAA